MDAVFGAVVRWLPSSAGFFSRGYGDLDSFASLNQEVSSLPAAPTAQRDLSEHVCWGWGQWRWALTAASRARTRAMYILHMDAAAAVRSYP
jgi:hypothetical protein